MANKNPEDREIEIIESLGDEERKRDKRPYLTKIMDTFAHNLKVFKERYSKIR
jgi:hypothetical protein